MKKLKKQTSRVDLKVLGEKLVELKNEERWAELAKLHVATITTLSGKLGVERTNRLLAPAFPDDSVTHGSFCLLVTSILFGNKPMPDLRQLLRG
ncbi:hypothetical protein HY772_10150 [Candidatus Woesearchaeota archaeon]|nr:hypothetical protein [Candidatus Woesearchaeota archaeon]